MLPTPKEICQCAELVFEKPLSDAFDEVLFGSALRNTLWVRFFDEHGITEWIGKFDCGNFGGNKVTKAVAPDKFFVCAGGWIYFVDGTNRVLSEEPLCEGTILDAFYDPIHKGVLVAGWSNISLICSREEEWSINTKTHGIRNLRLEGSILHGLGEFDYNGSESEFTLDLETKKLSIGKSRASTLPVTAIPPQKEAKAWWRFW